MPRLVCLFIQLTRSFQYYDMEKYEIKMRLIRGGEAVPDMPGSSTYDPNADMAAHSKSLKVRLALPPYSPSR